MLERKRNPYLATDAVIINPLNKKVVLIRRKNDPFKNYWALPGGFVEWGETVENACMREAKEETSLDIEILDLIGVFSDPNRDPRGHVVSIAFLCIVKSGSLVASSDAKYAAWVDIEEILKGQVKLAFDHYDIILKGIKKAKERGLI